MKKWKCTVCNYIHVGDEPPEKCPVCGSDKSLFIEVTEEAPPKSASQEVPPKAPESEPEGEPTDIHPTKVLYIKMEKNPRLKMVMEQILAHHLHPISVHMPNGVIPISVLFVFIGALFSIPAMIQANFYYLLFIVLSLPIVLITGYVEWQKKYQGALTQLFVTKIISALVCTGSAVLIVIWYAVNPVVMTGTSSFRWLFALLNLVMLVSAGIAGFIGGKLVFKD